VINDNFGGEIILEVVAYNYISHCGSRLIIKINK
jgi:hypothetical protein